MTLSLSPMAIHCPDIWFRDPRIDYGARTISMAAILPRVGARMSAGFTPITCLRAGDVKTLLWKPPISELNGWSEQPSEIAQSYLVGARIIKVAVEGDHLPGSSHLYRHDLDILSCVPLLPTLRQLDDGVNNWSLARIGHGYVTPPTFSLVWDEVHWCGTAAIDGLIYIVGTAWESHMELIVEEIDDKLFGLFNGYMNPGGGSYDLGRCRLDEREQKSIRQAIHKSHRLADTFPAYLAE
ncbi:hypothetical protein [Massilia antarctica]|uniref:hypothetical protein n=1 Tax=Massilia antarctica TaxID=2765360 RepID=UPI0006BD9942|nr:hypothetical protein [Massilia sp. H27-R4]MCY0915192.1 hypothetical protein [Massilia sp. H27-R4]CUI07180.1 hypothetical protein BN2497_9137 [Janthinobacterium sp. CG23_2]CUU30966.1 hypothetical protein BN3177_9137 [Janthinobacterium sp. CG23_2]